ncbi:MAG: amidohydrolase [Deltaproteobacteria bacterium]|nr:amidohydrolase [Deltaproteobacteria bacterium]
MIIDTHVHLIIPGFVKGKFLMDNARMASTIYNRVYKTNITPSEYIDKLKERVDPDCSKLIETMDSVGIDKSVIFGVDWAYAVTGEPRVSNREQNRTHAEMAKKWEGRFVPLAALDPRRPDIIDQAKEAVEEWGMKGFKLHPSAGFYPNEAVCFPLYEKCAEWGVPIMFHSGGIEFNWEYGLPNYIASAAEHFPEVKMVIAHAGLESWHQARLAATALQNVYVDISIRQLDYCVNPGKFYEWLRDFIDWTGPWKVMFASDTPMPTLWCPQDEWVKAIKEPDTDIHFSKEELDIIMGKAAQAVFNIED